MKSKSVKLYTYHSLYQEFPRKRKNSALRAGVRVLLLPWRAAVKICDVVGTVVYLSLRGSARAVLLVSFGIGSAIIWPITSTKKGSLLLAGEVHKELSRTHTGVALTLNRLRGMEFRFAVAVFLILCAGASAGLHGLRLIASGLDLKGKVLGQTTEAVAHLTRGKDLLEQSQINPAAAEFTQALERFNTSKNDIDNAHNLLPLLLRAIPAKNDADKVLSAGALLSRTALRLTELYDFGKNLRVGPGGIAGAHAFATPAQQGVSNAETFNRLQQAITESSNDLSLASSDLDGVNVNSLPAEHREKFLETKAQVKAAAATLGTFNQMAGLLKTVLMGKHKVLFVLENNNELRATGGFIGSFGELDIADAQIGEVHISSVYDLDGQLTEKIIPPYPLFNVNDRWYLRDSNWFVDFKSSAETIVSFFEKERGYTPDYVFALTPELIRNFLEILGPVSLPQYGVVLDSDNFVELTQAATSIYYDKAENKPKQMLGDVLRVLLERTAHASGRELLQISGAVQKNLNTKHILAYARSAAAEKQFEDFNWAGRIHESHSDFLGIFTSNLNGSKTDLSVTTSTELESKVSEDGTITNILKITRDNPLPPVENLSNLSFIRVLVPEGSELIKSQGSSYVNLEAKYKATGKVDSRVAEWERNSVKDLTTGTLIGSESGHTFFGNWLEVKGGETKTLTLEYRLPGKAEAIDTVSLLLQKQPGTGDIPLHYSLSYPGRSARWLNFSPEEQGGDSLHTSVVWNRDMLIGGVFSK